VRKAVARFRADFIFKEREGGLDVDLDVELDDAERLGNFVLSYQIELVFRDAYLARMLPVAGS
jgi:hypothetical protein